MAQGITGDVRAIAVAGVGSCNSCAGEGLSLHAPEALALKEQAVGVGARRDWLNSRALGAGWVGDGWLEAIIVHAADRRHMRARDIVDGRVARVGPIGHTIQVVVIDLDVEGFFNRADGPL